MSHTSNQKSTSNKRSGMGNLPQSGCCTVLEWVLFFLFVFKGDDSEPLFLEAADAKLQECVYNQALECGQLRAMCSFVSCLMVRVNELSSVHWKRDCEQLNS